MYLDNGKESKVNAVLKHIRFERFSKSGVTASIKTSSRAFKNGATTDGEIINVHYPTVHELLVD